jgi:hypothetical protein
MQEKPVKIAWRSPGAFRKHLGCYTDYEGKIEDENSISTFEGLKGTRVSDAVPAIVKE